MTTGLNYYRDRKGLTQVALAKQLAIDPTHLSKMEQGHVIPTPEQVDRLVELLEVPPTYLFSKHILAEVAERARAEAAS